MSTSAPPHILIHPRCQVTSASQLPSWTLKPSVAHTGALLISCATFQQHTMPVPSIHPSDHMSADHWTCVLPTHPLLQLHPHHHPIPADLLPTSTPGW